MVTEPIDKKETSVETQEATVPTMEHGRSGSPVGRSRLDRVLIGALAALLVLVGVAGVLVFRAMPRQGEAPRTAAQAAVEKALAAVDADPASVYNRLVLADAYFQFQMYDNTLRALEDARSLEPTGALAALVEIGYGRVYEVTGDEDSALEHYESSLEYETVFDALFALGNIARANGDDDTAVDYWLQALEVNGGAATLRVDVAAVYEERGEYDLALEQLEEALRFIPGDPKITEAIARVRDQAQ